MQDIQSVVEFKRKEEKLVHDFFQATNPYMFINHSSIANSNLKGNY